MTSLKVIHASEDKEWLNVLRQTCQHDFYHLPAYHTLTENYGEEKSCLFVYTEGHYIIALPLLLRPIKLVPRLEQTGAGWWDATSVYGYAGPVASHENLPASVVESFQCALLETFQEQQIVTVFSRLHPLLPQQKILSGMGTFKYMGQTVSIDLTLPVTAQRALYRKDHKWGTNKLKRLDVTCLNDQEKVHLNEFIDIYYETMQRVKAADNYYFDHAYFKKLTSIPQLNSQLFICCLKNEIICSGLAILCNNIVQFHLSGTRTEFLKLAPTKLLVDTIRLWGSLHKAHTFHLGGGVGAQEDPLFYFKAGFSNRRHEFLVWNWILLPDIFDTLCKKKAEEHQQNGLKTISTDYFPAYRSKN